MSKGNYKSKNRAAVLYVKDILENYSTIEAPLSNAKIREILEKEYNIELHRETVKEILDELAAYDGDLYKCATSNQKDREGYSYGWYYNRSSSDYDVIKNAIKDLYDNPAIPLDIARTKADRLMNLIPETHRDESLDEDASVRRYKIDNETYQMLQQIKQVIIENRNNKEKEKYIRFTFKTYDIENKKVIVNQARISSRNVLPLTVVERNNRYWLIYYISDRLVSNDINHFCIDMMNEIRIIEKDKQDNPAKSKLIKKVMSDEGIQKYVNEYIGIGNQYNGPNRKNTAAQDITLKIRKDRRMGITYFYDIFKDDFKVLKEKKDHYIVKVRCTRQVIEYIVFANIENIEIIEPEVLQAQIVHLLEDRLRNMLTSTNRVTLRSRYIDGNEKLPAKVSDDEKWFYVDFIYNPLLGGRCQEFVEYLMANGFKEKAMKIRHKGIPANRYLTTNKYSSYQDVVKMIKKFADKNRWFYRRIKSYSVYEYKEAPKTADSDKLEKKFCRVYYYKDINVSLVPVSSYSETLTRNYLRRNNRNDK